MIDEKVMYRGKWYVIQIHKDTKRRRARLELEGDKMIVHTPIVSQVFLREAMEKWLSNQARMVFPVRVMHFQRLTGGTVRQIRVKDQKTRWGSCSSLHNLNFSWRLIMAPPEVLDYVVVHELCHLTHMNHSRDFWDMVERIMPEYRQYKQWLKENGHLLQLAFRR